MASRAWLACLGLVVWVGCGQGSADRVPESPFVDHDLGVSTSELRVGDAGGCDTSIVKALSAQLVEQLSCIHPNAMVSFAGPNVDLGPAVQPFLQPAAAAALKRATTSAGKVIPIDSAYRTVAQQFLLYKWWQAGLCDIQTAAKPGLSNHQSGLAIDTGEFAAWKSALTAQGWQWFGSEDEVH